MSSSLGYSFNFTPQRELMINLRTLAKGTADRIGRPSYGSIKSQPGRIIRFCVSAYNRFATRKSEKAKSNRKTRRPLRLFPVSDNTVKLRADTQVSVTSSNCHVNSNSWRLTSHASLSRGRFRDFIAQCPKSAARPPSSVRSWRRSRSAGTLPAVT